MGTGTVWCGERVRERAAAAWKEAGEPRACPGGKAVSYQRSRSTNCISTRFAGFWCCCTAGRVRIPISSQGIRIM